MIISWVLLFLLFISLTEMMHYLDDNLNKIPNIRDTKKRLKELKRKRIRTAKEQFEYIKKKKFSSEILGGFSIKLICSIAVFIAYSNFMSNNSFTDPILIIYFLIQFCMMGALLMFVMVNSTYKLYLMHYEYWLMFFILGYMTLDYYIGFYIGTFRFNMLLMLPIFLIVRILYNNVRTLWCDKHGNNT